MEEREATPVDNLDDDEKLNKYKLDIDKDAGVMYEQAEAANEDMRFINVKGGMWEGFLSNDFSADRVRMEFDLVSNFLQRFLGRQDLNPIGVDYKPDDGKTSDDDAELLNGIYRADFRNFSGRMATDNATQEASTCGVGAMKLQTIFEDEEDPENELQRIEWKPIYNAYNTVIWDEAAQRIDKRDARWCTTLKPFTTDSFEAAYPGKDAVSAYTPNTFSFDNTNYSQPSLIYVATRYEVIKKNEKVFVYNNLTADTGGVETYSAEDHELIKDELKANPAYTFVRERTILRRTIEKSVFSGAEFLQKPKRIVGKWIPIIPFYAYRSYVDGSEWYRGLIRKLKDPQRTFNVEMSQLAENAASNGQDVPIFLREQMENPDVQSLWANKNNKPYLVVDPVINQAGEIVNAGPLGYSKPGQLDGSTTALLQLVPEFVRDTTGGAPQETLNPDASGKAIKALIEREDLTTAKVTKNFTDAVIYSGEVYQAMASEVYSEPRILRTIGKDGNEQRTELFEAVMDEETGTPVEANTILGKKFRAYADVGPNYDTLREQTVEDLKGMLEMSGDNPAAAQYFPVLIGTMLENISGVGMDKVKDFNRKIMLQQGLIKPETDEEKAQLAQFQQEQQKGNAQEELLRAAAEQAQAEARNLDAASAQKLADVDLKGAQTMETLAGIDIDEQKNALQAEKQADDRLGSILKSLQGMPVEGNA